MIRPVMIIFIFFVFLGVTRTAQSKKRRSVAQPSEITVTLKIEWNVTVVGKPIPANYVTKVKNGTVLEDILNKAADEDSRGPFNKYDSTYHAGLGYSITAMNGIKVSHSTSTYWLIFDEQTGGSIPCGITSYVPQDNSTTIFRLTASSGHNGSVTGYCKSASSNSQVPASLIKVTIALDWDVERVGKPIPAPYTTHVANGTVLEDILNKAADANAMGPFNKYETTYHSGLGYSITAMNGIEQDPQTSTYWIIYDDKTGKPTPHGVNQFKPKNNSVTIFRLVSPTETRSEGATHKVFDTLVVLVCLLAIPQHLYL